MENLYFFFHQLKPFFDLCNILLFLFLGDKVKSETANAIGRVGFVLATYNDGDFDIYWKYNKKLWEKFREVGTRKEKDLVYYIKG